MYAVIESGGKQYRVAQGQRLKLDKLPTETGEAVRFDRILMVADGKEVHVGTPFLNKAAVEAEVVTHGRGKKINIIKFKRRKHHLKRMGHRQDYTEVKIGKITL